MSVLLVIFVGAAGFTLWALLTYTVMSWFVFGKRRK